MSQEHILPGAGVLSVPVISDVVESVVVATGCSVVVAAVVVLLVVVGGVVVESTRTVRKDVLFIERKDDSRILFRSGKETTV